MRAKIADARTHGIDGAWQAVSELGGGEYGIRAGLMPLDFNGYPIPDQHDKERLSNRDVRGLLMLQALDETVALGNACKERDRLRAQGLKHVVLPKEHGGVQSWEEWAQARKAALSAMVSHGR